MKKNEIMTKIGGALSKVNFKFKQHSPEILIAAGVVGTVVSAVMACKATTKLSTILDKTSDDIEAVHDAETNEELAEQYSAEDARKDLTIIYAHAAWDVTRLYAPSAALGALSIISILTSHKIMVKRNMALALAYANVSDSFKAYRQRVVERFGENIDRELRYNIKAKEIQETVVDDKGKEKTVKKTVDVAGPLGHSDYARFFDESSRNWEKNGEYNLMFLRAQQARANDMLRSRGYLFLSEVYQMLDLREDEASRVVGWVFDHGSAPAGDNYVDFGITEVDREARENPDEEPERTIILDFNVDGYILKHFMKFDTTH